MPSSQICTQWKPVHLIHPVPHSAHMDSVTSQSQRHTDVCSHEQPLFLQPRLSGLSESSSSTWIIPNGQRAPGNDELCLGCCAIKKTHKKSAVSVPSCWPQVCGFNFEIYWNMAVHDSMQPRVSDWCLHDSFKHLPSYNYFNICYHSQIINWIHQTPAWQHQRKCLPWTSQILTFKYH